MRQIARLLRRPLYIAAGLVTVVAVTAALRPGQHGFWRPGPCVDSASLGEYEVRIYQRHKCNLFETVCGRLPYPLSNLQYKIPGYREWCGFEVRKNGRRVHAEYGVNIDIADFGSNRVAGLDITGNGTPKLAVTDYFGPEGGGSLMLFECGRQFRQIARVSSVGYFPELKDLDGDGVAELIVSDDAFHYWPIWRGGEPMPTVILRWRDGKYVPATDLMFKAAPPLEDLSAKAKMVQSLPGWDQPGDETVIKEIAATVLELIYSGHEELAWRFIDAAWKPGAAAYSTRKEDFVAQLRGRLEGSTLCGGRQGKEKAEER